MEIDALKKLHPKRTQVLIDKTQLKLVDYELRTELNRWHFILYCEDKNAKEFQLVIKLPHSMDVIEFQEYIESIL